MSDFIVETRTSLLRIAQSADAAIVTSKEAFKFSNCSGPTGIILRWGSHSSGPWHQLARAPSCLRPQQPVGMDNDDDIL